MENKNSSSNSLVFGLWPQTKIFPVVAEVFSSDLVPGWFEGRRVNELICLRVTGQA